MLKFFNLYNISLIIAFFLLCFGLYFVTKHKVELLNFLKKIDANLFFISLVSFLVIVYKNPIFELLANPPSYVFVITIVLYFLTILNNSNRDIQVSLKEQLKKIEKGGEIDKKITELDQKSKKLSIKTNEVKKMSQSLTKANSNLQNQIDDLPRAIHAQIDIKFDQINSRVDLLQTDVNSLKTDVNSLKTDVNDIKVLLNTIISRLPQL
jgi:methyl-accepting chemotaxis protein